MMRYKVKEIGEAGIDIRVEIRDPWLAAECTEAKLRVSPMGLVLKGRLEPVGDGFLLRGDLQGSLLGPCARCLEDATIPLDVPIVFSFIERFSSPSSKDEEAEEEEEEQSDRVFFDHGLIDLSPTLRDELLLALPIRSLCSDACLGICPTCGVNKNNAHCDCVEALREKSPFATLAKMKRE